MGNPEGENIEVVYNEEGEYLIKLGDNAIQLDSSEAEQLLLDLATAMKATYYKKQAEGKLL